VLGPLCSEALCALRVRNSAAVAACTLRCLAHPLRAVRAAAAAAVTAVAERGDGGALAEARAAAHAVSSEARAAALAALGALALPPDDSLAADSRVLPLLLSRLGGDPAPAVRRQAMQVLREVCGGADREALAAIAAAVADPDVQTRLEVGAVLLRILQRGCPPPLVLRGHAASFTPY
jgi:hypothetical protein